MIESIFPALEGAETSALEIIPRETRQEQLFDEQGKPQTDEEGNPVVEPIKVFQISLLGFNKFVDEDSELLDIARQLIEGDADA